MSTDSNGKLRALLDLAGRIAGAESRAESIRLAIDDGVAAVGGRAGAFDEGADGTARASGAPDGRVSLAVRAKGAGASHGVLSATFPAGERGDVRALLASLADLLGAALDRWCAEVAKDAFLAMASHELRGPHAVVSMWTHVLGLKTTDEPGRGRALEAIEASVRGLGRQIDDIVDLSRLMRGSLVLEHSLLSLGKLVRGVAGAVASLAATRGIVLDVRIDSEATMSGDEARLRQALDNVVANALEFTPSGGRVEISLVRAGAAVRVTVRDDGQGIAPALLPHLFAPFQLRDASLARTRGGFGLGLAVAQQIVAAHGGTIGAESAGQAGGATFTIALPLTPGSER